MRDEVVGPLRIDSLAFGGSGVARHDGRVIFVAGAVPGDVVSVRPLKVKKRYAEAQLIDLVQPAAPRCEPVCPVFGDCGGCQWQMLPYAEQLRHKEEIFRDILMRQCQLAPESVGPIVAAPHPWNYRSRMQFKCHALADGRLAIGFFRGGSHFVVDIDSCPIAASEFNRLLPLLKRSLHKSADIDRIPQIDMEMGDRGRIRVIVHYLGRDTAGLAALLAPLVREQGVTLFFQQGRKEGLRHQSGDDLLRIEVDAPPLQLAYAAGGFAQVNLEQNRRMVEAALRMTAPQPGWRVLDLYCGMGNFSLPFARRVRSVVAVEEFAASVEQGRRNARENRLDNLEFAVGSAVGAVRTFAGGEGFDLVILDPPRTGAREVAFELAEHAVPRVLYISCDPMTLSRDLKILLQNGYRLVQSRPLDMFPQTWHLESVNLLEYCGSDPALEGNNFSAP